MGSLPSPLGSEVPTFYVHFLGQKYEIRGRCNSKKPVWAINPCKTTSLSWFDPPKCGYFRAQRAGWGAHNDGVEAQWAGRWSPALRLWDAAMSTYYARSVRARIPEARGQGHPRRSIDPAAPWPVWLVRGAALRLRPARRVDGTFGAQVLGLRGVASPLALLMTLTERVAFPRT